VGGLAVQAGALRARGSWFPRSAKAGPGAPGMAYSSLLLSMVCILKLVLGSQSHAGDVDGGCRN